MEANENKKKSVNVTALFLCVIRVKGLLKNCKRVCSRIGLRKKISISLKTDITKYTPCLLLSAVYWAWWAPIKIRPSPFTL